MRFGVHVRTGMGLEKAVVAAAEIGCEAVQIFASNPNAWRSGKLDPKKVEMFRDVIAKYEISPTVIHTPYLLNLAAPDPDIYSKSTTALSDAMSRAKILGITYVVTHIGSHKGEGFEGGVERICRSVSDVLDGTDSPAVLLLENSAGAGDSIGSKFEHLGAILEGLGKYEGRLGICLDTAHLWGAGYDISGPEQVVQTVQDFEEKVGLRWLSLMHLNDTHMGLGSCKDRHAHIGTGHIGESGFAALVNHPALASLAGIVETPPRLPEEERDLDILKRLRDQ